MFITRKNFEREIKRAELKGRREAIKEYEQRTAIDIVQRNMWDSSDRLNTSVAALETRISCLETELRGMFGAAENK